MKNIVRKLFLKMESWPKMTKKGEKIEELYDQKFYELQKIESTRSAQSVIPLVLQLAHPESVIDVGCGIGTWLSVFKDMSPGIQLLGLDGEYNRERLLIDAHEFIGCDLEDPLPSFPSKFDLAMSLEVAEHLSPQRAPSFVKELTSLSGVILFSAAWPGQTGVHHINEQWHDYWVRLFANAGFIPVDCIRPLIMKHRTVSWYYRSNILLFINKDFLSRLDFSKGDWRTLQKFYIEDPYAAFGLFQRIGRKLDKNSYLTQLKRSVKTLSERLFRR
jgi:SAM-dependent methyltransferase